METPKKPVLKSPIVPCNVTIENLNSQGAVQKSAVHKNVSLTLGRNEFKDMILLMESKNASRKFCLKEIQVHAKFAKEGKATVRLKALNTNLMISNAPPNTLITLLKILATKNATPNRKEPISMRERLKSLLPQSFDEISPLTSKEYENGKKRSRNPLAEKNSTVPGASPVSSRPKRKRTDDSPSPVPAKVSRFLNPITLNKEQKAVLESINSGKNIFFTGSAGTGKSFLLKRIVGALPPDVTYVTASTGVAACQINGTTLHSFAGIGSGEASTEQCIALGKRKMVAQQWRKCQYLIIDEISMVDGEFFDKLEVVARKVRGNDKPFGGIQLILCGDFLQLPPVCKKGDKRKFCFQSTAWDKCISTNMELTEVRRQDDAEFIDILQAIRLGRCTDEMINRLKETERNIVEKNGIQATRLCTHRDDVQHINNEHLTKLPGSCRKFIAIDSDSSMSQVLDNQTPVLNTIVLKVGAQVMLMKNLDVAKGLVNGARGVVTSFMNGTDGCPIVRFVCGITTEIKHEKWTVKGFGGAYVTRRQIPLKLAWAFSIHKSQGMTLDCVQMSLSRVFEAGQAYVALSRARNLNSIRLIDFNSSCIRAHPDVLKFYQRLRKQTIEAQEYMDRFIKLGVRR